MTNLRFWPNYYYNLRSYHHFPYYQVLHKHLLVDKNFIWCNLTASHHWIGEFWSDCEVEMSVYGGDSWGREAQYRKRRVDDLLVEGLDLHASKCKKLASGKFLCLLCPNNPLLDSPLMLSVSIPTSPSFSFFWNFMLSGGVFVFLPNWKWQILAWFIISAFGVSHIEGRDIGYRNC